MNKWFNLPRVGKETFSELMRAKVRYDSKFGFMLTSSTNVERALSIMSSALNEKVAIASACFVCEGPLDSEVDPETGSDSTLCLTCQRNEDVFDLYRLKFGKFMESV